MIRSRLKFHHPAHTDQKLNSSISEILNGTELFAMASIRGDESYINTAYYSFNSQLDFFFLSEITSQHVLNVSKNRSVSLGIYDSGQRWGGADRGLQLFGECALASRIQHAEAVKHYTQRFSDFWKFFRREEDYKAGVANFLPLSNGLPRRILRFYIVKIRRLKLFDEVDFKADPFISLTLEPESEAV